MEWTTVSCHYKCIYIYYRRLLGATIYRSAYVDSTYDSVSSVSQYRIRRAIWILNDNFTCSSLRIFDGRFHSNILPITDRFNAQNYGVLRHPILFSQPGYDETSAVYTRLGYQRQILLQNVDREYHYNRFS